MSIDKRGNNNWRFRVMIDGQVFTQNFQGSKAEAKKAHNIFKADIQRGLVGTNETLKFSELAQIVFDDYVKPNLKYRTQEIYKTAYNNYLLKQFGNLQISKITPISSPTFYK